MKVLLKRPFLVLLLPLVAAILVWYALCRPDAKEVLPSAPFTARVLLLTVPEQHPHTLQAQGRVLSLTDSACASLAGLRLQFSFARDSLSEQLQQGDVVVARIRPGRANRGNPCEFDYDTWLRRQGIAGTAYVASGRWLWVEHTTLWHPRAVAERWQTALQRHFSDSGISGRNLAVLSALALGERSGLDAQTRRSFAAAGAMHVLAVSGLHTGVVWGALMWLLTGFGLLPVLYGQHRRKVFNALMTIVMLWLYAFLTGLSPSVVRAALMLSLFSVAPLVDREADSYNIICASAFLTLAVSPLSLFSVSFQLSYAAVLGIVFFTPRLQKLLPLRNRLLRRVWQLLCMSVAAQLATLPLTLWYFRQFSVWFALTNLVVVPAASIIVYTALFFLLCTPLPWLSGKLAWLLDKQMLGLNTFVQWVESLPHSVAVFSLTWPMLLALGAAVLLLVVWLVRWRWPWLVACVLTLGGFAGLHVARLHEVAHTDRLLVYNTPHSVVLLHRQGRRCLLLTDSVADAVRVTEPYRRQQMLCRPEVLPLTDCSASWHYAGRSFLLVRDSLFAGRRLSEPLSCDVLLCGARGGRVAAEALKIKADTVLLLGCMSERQRSLFKETAAETGTAGVLIDLQQGGVVFQDAHRVSDVGIR